MEANVTDEVRDFYDRYPYPRPVEDLDFYREQWEDPERRRADFHVYWPFQAFREDNSILIAGCGTSQAAKHAIRWPAAKITAIDLSATSVRHTEDLKRRYNLTNLQVHQLPIDRLTDLHSSFDQIVCTGVLHHLPDPDAGLRALRAVLHPDGAMHLMLYAPYGRAGIYMLQEFAHRLGIRATDDGIRDLIAALHLLPAGHPLENLLRQAPDFRHEAALADALLHPQDRAYSVPQLFDFLHNAGLTFARWIKQAPYSPHCGVLSQIPQSSRLAQLPPVSQYAAAELFRGTMLMHSFIARRDDAEVHPISFAGVTWPTYIPIRTPDTIVVEDKGRLPPNTAAVLINQSHTYTDIYLPISAAEKLLFDAIDGSRNIAEIAERTVHSAPGQERVEAARSFFEKLWWHDQVVFDASNSP
jgi:2-polyprenyl-3-methyl-5-hydroxy-6-metoxy-1,4-benzoquinol methylase